MKHGADSCVSHAGHSHAGHSHAGGHEHAHEHEHKHEHEHRTLREGEGKGKTLFFDAFSGVAGDMTIASLLDLGVPFSVVEEVVQVLRLEGCSLDRTIVWRNGIRAVRFDVHVTAPQPERTWPSIDSMIAGAGLRPAVREMARKVFRKIAQAEAQVHGTTPEKVHFHEVGAVDSIVDIVGACAMIAWLDPDAIACSPLPIGHGTVQSRHGVLPLPAPATLLCLAGVPTVPLDVEGETVTPTGAAIVASLSSSFVRWPAIVPEAAGWGAGTHDLGAHPNLLRVVLGPPSSTPAAAEDSGTHAVLEANVDDMTGELAGHVISALMREGALDVSILPTTAKKGRPGMLLSVISSVAQREQVARAILRETTTIGVRWHVVHRIERERRIEVVSTPWGQVPVKVSGGLDLPEQAKPEFEVCERMAAETGTPVRDVVAAAMAAWSALRSRA